MSNASPPIEQQRFARTQTPESPRPVHVPEPAKIPVLLNQMDPVFNDTNTYNVPTDQTFAGYGDSLEQPNYRKQAAEENDAFQDFFRQADNSLTRPAESNVPENANETTQDTNQAALPTHDGQAGQDQTVSGYHPCAPNHAQTMNPPPPAQIEGYGGNSTNTSEPASNSAERHESENNNNPSRNEVGTSTTAQSEARSEAGVDYQSLLDTIAQSASTAPAAENVAALPTEPEAPDSHISSLPSFPGLPPKPPPLETQNVFPSSVDSAQAKQQPTSAEGAAYQIAANGYAPNTNENKSSSTNDGHAAVKNPFDVGITNEQAIAMHMQHSQQNATNQPPSPPERVATESCDRPWSPKTQASYDAFLEDERRYVTEGIWDRFPMGSRLFVGNLPSEKVTKRDLFHKFHRHGKLAQISIKQAYGFVQYHDSESCKRALDAEQGVEIRGRKVHLEVSKPQKNTKNVATNNNNNSRNQNQNRRRSRSPQRRSYSDYRDEPGRRREEYRNRRSPSPPRGYRRDDRTASRDDRRSPIYGGGYGPPQPAAFDDEASLPYPRRDPRNVPDVQLIVLDSGVNPAFITWVDDGFRRKGLSVATTSINQRAPLPAVVKRQIVEGVQAVVKLSASLQARSKIPLQVFDRSAGGSNVSFNEYVDLDIPVAADIVLQARQKERAEPPRPPYPPHLMPPHSPYQQHQSPNSPWGAPVSQHQPPLAQYPPHYGLPPQPPQPQFQQGYRPPQPAYSNPPSTGTQPPNLHELLANLKGNNAPPTPQSAHSAGQPHTPYGQPPPQYAHPQYGQPPPLNPYGQPQYPPTPQQQQHSASVAGQQNVRSIMDQLARYNQR